MTFGTFLITKISPNYEFLLLTIFSLVFAITANLTSFGLSLLAYKVRYYYFIMREGYILDENRLTIDQLNTLTKRDKSTSVAFDETKIVKYESMDESEFYSDLIRYYLMANAIRKIMI